MVIPNEDTIKKNQRIKVQEGCLWICGNYLINEHNQICTSLTSKYMKINKEIEKEMKKEEKKRNYPVPHALKDHHTLLKIVIPYEIKQQMLEELKDKGITKDSLFPKENI